MDILIGHYDSHLIEVIKILNVPVLENGEMFISFISVGICMII